MWWSGSMHRLKQKLILSFLFLMKRLHMTPVYNFGKNTCRVSGWRRDFKSLFSHWNVQFFEPNTAPFCWFNLIHQESPGLSVSKHELTWIFPLVSAPTPPQRIWISVPPPGFPPLRRLIRSSSDWLIAADWGSEQICGIYTSLLFTVVTLCYKMWNCTVLVLSLSVCKLFLLQAISDYLAD